MEEKKDLSHIDFDKLIKAVEALYDPQYNTEHINGYDFVCTCHACPEQYDVYKGDYTKGDRVAYVRKRWGYLAVHPVIGYVIDWDKLIYEETEDDEYGGTINDREKTFNKIINAIESYQQN